MVVVGAGTVVVGAGAMVDRVAGACWTGTVLRVSTPTTCVVGGTVSGGVVGVAINSSRDASDCPLAHAAKAKGTTIKNKSEQKTLENLALIKTEIFPPEIPQLCFELIMEPSFLSLHRDYGVDDSMVNSRTTNAAIRSRHKFRL